MDFLGELEVKKSFVLATNVNPEWFVEYLPVEIRSQPETKESLYLLFPHVLGRPSGKYDKNIFHIWAYNGYVRHILGQDLVGTRDMYSYVLR